MIRHPPRSTLFPYPTLSRPPDWKSTFPPHCMRGTPGQKKIPETALRDPLVVEPARTDPKALADRVRAHRGDILFHKHWFDVLDRKSTRLNSSHSQISYAVFC